MQKWTLRIIVFVRKYYINGKIKKFLYKFCHLCCAIVFCRFFMLFRNIYFFFILFQLKKTCLDSFYFHSIRFQLSSCFFEMKEINCFTFWFLDIVNNMIRQVFLCWKLGLWFSNILFLWKYWKWDELQATGIGIGRKWGTFSKTGRTIFERFYRRICE